MKILYGVTKSNFGGAQRYVFELALEARNRGHEVAVVFGGSGTLKNKLDAEGIQTFSLASMERDISIFKEFKSFFSLLNIIDEYRPDIFHINSSKMAGIGSVAGRLKKVEKIIFTSHGWAFNEPRPAYQQLIIKLGSWISILLSHKTICVSKKVYEQISSWPFTKNKLKTIHNGIEEFPIDTRSHARDKFALGIPDKIIVVGTIAELHPIKGIDILLKAWAVLAQNHNGRLIIIGDGEEREHLENMAKNMGISESVMFKGFVDNARSLLSGIDIFVLPSRSEGLPYVVLEAGISGTPVIATKVGGIPEIITDKKEGILIEPNNTKELFESLKELVENEELRKELSKNLKTRIEKDFSREEMFNETFKLYS